MKKSRFGGLLFILLSMSILGCTATKKTGVGSQVVDADKDRTKVAEQQYFDIDDNNRDSKTADAEELEITEAEKKYFDIEEAEPVTIADEETEYEIIILEPGFNFWLQSIARQRGYYSQSFLENRNQILVTNWNQRVMQPQRFDPNLYQLQIDYSPHIDYGYEVNYKLYNYFIFFQRRYGERLSGFIPRI